MAYCEECGRELTMQDRFCAECGHPIAAPSLDVAQTDAGAESVDLKNLLIYRMSNGSHELFHSNLIAWMLERDHNFAEVFFKELKGERYEVFREKKHMDIVLETDNAAYVIENKFKSLPGTYQLERYQNSYEKEKPAKSFAAGALLGVHDVLGNECPQKWHYVDYQEVADYIDNSVANAPSTDKKDFEHLTVIQYGRLIRQLKKRFEQEIDWEGKKMPSPSDFDLLDGIQLKDLCKKIQTAVFARRLSKQIDERLIDAEAVRYGFRFKITTNFLRGDAILEVRFFKDSRREVDQKKDDNWGADCTIGVEVHADKYMWFVKCDEDEVSAQTIVKLLWDKNWFTNDPNRTTVSGRRQKDGLYSFGKEFQYQYLPLQGEHDFSFEFLSNMIQGKLNEAKNLLSLLNQELNGKENKHGIL